jgi:hypothetical protein
MSMINDALKRAQNAQPKAVSADGPAMQAVEAARHPGKGVDVVMVLLIVTILSLAGVLIFAWYHAGTQFTVRARTTDTTANVAAAIPAPKPAVSKPSIASNAVANVVAPVAAVIPTTNAAAVAPQPPKPAPFVFKLQGVMFGTRNPSALINGKTVFVGERIADARVVAIGHDTATIITADGKTKLLDLP